MCTKEPSKIYLVRYKFGHTNEGRRNEIVLVHAILEGLPVHFFTVLFLF